MTALRDLRQFTLDLFGDAPAPVAAASGEAPRGAYRADGPGAIEPVRYDHPRANRELLIEGARIGYEFARTRRRTIGFAVGADGLSVRAPRWVPLREVDTALREKSAWILRKLDEARQRQNRLDAARIVWKDGAAFPFLGEPVVLRLDPRHGFTAVGAQLMPALAGEAPRCLQLALPHQASAQQIRDAAQAWLMRQARSIFAERMNHFAPRLGVAWRKLILSNAATRWGSASADGTIRLHWRLVHCRMPVIDYVVAHELSHLRVMDHSARFWETVESVVPDYAEQRRQLKDEPMPRW